jgi:hypothetical protein
MEEYHSIYSTISLEAAEIAHELAKWIYPNQKTGIPETLRDSFPGLSTKSKAFGVGEVERAKQWLQKWLTNNAKEYLKICDPYFGISEIEYLRYVPADCEVRIVTTDHFFKNGNTIKSDEEIKSELERHWEYITTQVIPRIMLIIIPKKSENKFHDRAIVSRYAGLKIGQSLNGLGKSQGTITILLEEDAKELERVYLDEMVDVMTWFSQHLNPKILTLGGRN